MDRFAFGAANRKSIFPLLSAPFVLGKFDLSYFVLELDSRIECADDFFKMCVVDILAFVAFEILL